MTLHQRFMLSVGVAIVTASVLYAQHLPAPDPAAPAYFDLVTIRPNNSGEERGRMRLHPGGRLEVVNMPVWHLIAFAYPMEGFYKHRGGPAWLNAERFDMAGKLVGDPQQMPQAVRTLLTDRFKLKVRREKQELDIYALVLAKPGQGPSGAMRVSTRPCSAEKPVPGEPPCRAQLTLGRIKSSAASMAQIANTLAAQVGRVVVDQTGLTGRYDFEVMFAPEPPVINLPPDPDAAPPSADAPSIFTAVQETLGLKLVSTKGPVEVIFIESAERPSAD